MTKPHQYDYPMPAMAADIVVFSCPDYNTFHSTNEHTNVLLITRKDNGMLALPGGFMEINESTEQTAYRELQEETGLYDIPLAFIGLFDEPNRDPRSRIISSAYAGLVFDEPKVLGSDDAKDAVWFPIKSLYMHDLWCDHKEIIIQARRIISSSPYIEVDTNRVKFYV